LLAAKRGTCSNKLIPNKISPIFDSKLCLSFLGCFDLSSFFLFCKKENSAPTTSCSANIPKTEPLSPNAGALGFAYASDVAEDESCKPGHVVELSF
jgi:hypothetical protein